MLNVRPISNAVKRVSDRNVPDADFASANWQVRHIYASEMVILLSEVISPVISESVLPKCFSVSV